MVRVSGSDGHFPAVMPGYMLWEAEMAVRASAQWSATTHILTSGCCVRRWQSGVVA